MFTLPSGSMDKTMKETEFEEGREKGGGRGEICG